MSPSPWRLTHVPEIDSTSLQARRLINTGRAGSAHELIVADRQTGGIGRLSRPWASPAGGLWCTFILPAAPDVRPAAPGISPPPIHPWKWDRLLSTLGLRAALAVRAAIVDTIPDLADSPRLRIKWPNDTLLDGRKVSGVLCEVLRRRIGGPVALIGVGINANYDISQLPADLHARATTLQSAIGRAVPLDALREHLGARLAEMLDPDLRTPRIARLVREHLAGVGEAGPITLDDGTRTSGVLQEVNDAGEAMFTVDGRMITARSAAIVDDH